VNEPAFLQALAIGMLVLAVVVFLALFFIPAPYGRHVRSGWGPAIDNIKGWLLMEAPAPLVFALCFVLGSNPKTVTALVLLVLWQLHYVHRAFIYPFSLRGSDKRMPLVIVSSAVVFNTLNGYLNGRYIFTYSDSYTNEWLGDPRFIVGVALFITGYIINRQADGILRRLRQPGESGYLIANTGLYRWISCPNYFGELIIWTGWAVATWSLPGLVFAFWTAANLVPRAKSHHTWYRQNFPEYPPNRKALLPGLW
jgi:protein-S-isoprenylcysteine O-methyltransferase Ste14